MREGMTDSGYMSQEISTLDAEVDALRQQLFEQSLDTVPRDRYDALEASCSHALASYKSLEAQCGRQELVIGDLTVEVVRLQQQVAEGDKEIEHLDLCLENSEKEVETVRTNLLDRVIELEEENEMLKSDLAAAQSSKKK